MSRRSKGPDKLAAGKKQHENGDDALGLNTPIDRRDLLNSTLIAGGAILLSGLAPFELLAKDDWTGYGGVGDYANSNGKHLRSHDRGSPDPGSHL